MINKVSTSSANLVRAAVVLSRQYRIVAIVYIAVVGIFSLKVFASLLKSPEQKNRDFQKAYQSTRSTEVEPSISTASVKLYKSKDKLLVKFSSEIDNPIIQIDGQIVNADCEAKQCSTSNIKGNEAKVIWRQSNQQFSKRFKL